MMKKMLLAFGLGLMALCASARTPKLLTIGTATTATPTNGTSGVPIAEDSLHTWWLTGTTVSGSGSVTYTVDCSMDGTSWIAINAASTIALSTTPSADAFTDQSKCIFYRLNPSSLSGTGASVTLTVSY